MCTEYTLGLALSVNETKCDKQVTSPLMGIPTWLANGGWLANFITCCALVQWASLGNNVHLCSVWMCTFEACHRHLKVSKPQSLNSTSYVPRCLTMCVNILGKIQNDRHKTTEIDINTKLGKLLVIISVLSQSTLHNSFKK